MTPLESPRRRISPAAGLRLTASEWELACTFSATLQEAICRESILVFKRKNHVLFERNLVYVTRIIRKCREIKETSNPRITNQDLADATGKSERTVAQFLRGEIPNASCETVASICKELGVSEDEHYGITMPEPNPDEQLTKEIRTLESENHVLKIQNVELAGEVENLKLEVSHQKKRQTFSVRSPKRAAL
ncbi:MAG: helix-turn-helix domain-containing protein [Oscillospiraceae bacterium]